MLRVYQQGLADVGAAILFQIDCEFFLEVLLELVQVLGVEEVSNYEIWRQRRIVVVPAHLH